MTKLVYICDYVILSYMSEIQSKRGQYMKSWTSEERSKRMSEVARRKWAKIGKKERKEIAKKLTEARKLAGV